MSASAIPVSWQLADALVHHPGLGLVPSDSDDAILEGELRCNCVGPDSFTIDETYSVRMELPRTFPRALPRVFETTGRVPQSFHHNGDKTLCLGSPIAIRFELQDTPTIRQFIDRVVIPYFYSHAYFVTFGRPPFGELRHGAPGLEDDIRRLFHLPRGTDAEEFLRLASLKRRHANKHSCPCGSGFRLGRCHASVVHDARIRLGRFVCRGEWTMLVQQRKPRALLRAA
jgi:hypothetical protein